MAGKRKAGLEESEDLVDPIGDNSVQEDSGSPSPPAKLEAEEGIEDEEWVAGIYPGMGSVLPSDLGRSLVGIGEALNMPVWALIQSGHPKDSYGTLNPQTYEGFYKLRKSISDEGVVIVIDSPGGVGSIAYQIAELFRKRGRFIAVVPRYAKSAATLLALGAEIIYIDRDAELGPLDVQIIDPDKEQQISALDELQSLERLTAAGLEAIDHSMIHLIGRTGKKVETILPMTLEYVANMLRPLFEGIDVVHYTQMSRALKIAEEYATRLLMPNYGDMAKSIARKLVEDYPEHGFVIDIEEAGQIGLNVQPPTQAMMPCIDGIVPYLIESRQTIVGPIVKKQENGGE